VGACFGFVPIPYIMSFLNRLFRRIRPSRRVQPLSSPCPSNLDQPIDWDSDDAAELRDFLRTDPGRRFGLLLRQRVGLSALHAMRTEPHRLPWECGRSAGIEDTVAQIDLLADWRGELNREVRDEISVPCDADAYDRPDDGLGWLNAHQDHDDDGHRYGNDEGDPDDDDAEGVYGYRD
jgi:hypothetical protein